MGKNKKLYELFDYRKKLETYLNEKLYLQEELKFSIETLIRQIKLVDKELKQIRKEYFK